MTHSVSIAGAQVDILVQIRWAAVPVRVAVECKDHARPVGRGLVQAFGTLVHTLRVAQEVDIGALVARKGFSPTARLAAEKLNVHLLVPEDIISWGATNIGKAHCAPYGPEAYAIVDVLDGVHLDEQRTHFWHLVTAASQARKFAPAVDPNYLMEVSAKCDQLAQGLDSLHRSVAQMLRGILLYDRKLPEEAERHFREALDISARHAISPLRCESLAWIARCVAEKGDFTQALDLLEQAFRRASGDPALANVRAKNRYWQAKIHWLAFQSGTPTLSKQEIQRLFRESLAATNDLGLINYAEGARARLGEIEFADGNVVEALRLLLTSERRTPNSQDRAKLKPLIAKARARLSGQVAEAVEREIDGQIPLPVHAPDLRGTSPRVRLCDYAVWRFAKYPRDKILPYVLSTGRTWIQGLRHLLEDEELLSHCIEADRFQVTGKGCLLDAGVKKYRSLRARVRAAAWNPTSRDLVRRLQMCRRILLTSALVSDTGTNGGVALVPLSSDASSSIVEERDGYWRLTPNGQFGFPFTTKRRANLSQELTERLRIAATSLLATLVTEGSGSGVFPMSVDFFVSENTFNVLEIHYPSRGFEVLYAPFRDLVHGDSLPLNLYADTVSEFARSSNAVSVLFAHFDDLCDDSRRPRTEFYGYEFTSTADELARALGSVELLICPRWSTTDWRHGRIEYAGKVPSIVILDDIDPEAPIRSHGRQLLLPDWQLLTFLADRHAVKLKCQELNIPTPKWVTLGPASGSPVSEVTMAVGRFVVVKDRFHLPSWHAAKRRSEFLDLDDPFDCERLMRRARTSELIVEELVTSSVDSHGHCGELRIHATAVL